MFAKSQPCKMSCHIPCDFVKCHEVSYISRVLILMPPIKVCHGEEADVGTAVEPQVTKHNTVG